MRKQLGADPHHSNMRSVRLISTHDINVCSQIVNVHHAMRREGDPVRHADRAHLASDPGNCRCVLKRTHDVRAETEADQPRSFVDQALQGLNIQLASLRVDLPLPHHSPGLPQPLPTADIRFVILVRDHDLIAAVQGWADGLGQHIAVQRGGRP